MEAVGVTQLFARTTLEQDKAELARIRKEEPGNIRQEAIVALNVQTKMIFKDQLKFLRILQVILERIQDLDVDDMRGYSAATLEPVLQYEEKDSQEVQFKRRMGMRAYFK